MAEPSPTPPESGAASVRSPSDQSEADDAAVEHVDLSAEPIRPGTQAVVRRSIEHRQETVRMGLAVGAFSALVAVLVMLLLADYQGITVDNVEKIATIVVTPLTGIVGTIIGFYFAQRRDG